MRNRGLLAFLAVLAVALSVVLAGCGGGGGGNTVKIVSDLPLQGSNLVQTGQMVDAIEYVLEQADNKAGDYTIEFESFDDAIPSTGNWDEATCASNARTYADDDSIVGVIGTYNSGCAAIIIPILNEAGVAMISPANTYAGLTHAAPGTEEGRAGQVLPVRRRATTLRVVASDDYQGKVGAQFHEERPRRQERLHPRRQGALREGRRRRVRGLPRRRSDSRSPATRAGTRTLRTTPR